MASRLTPILIVPAALAWILVVLPTLISRKGWSRFAEWHPATLPPAGTVYTVPEVRFSTFGRYSNAVRVNFTEAGIYFRMFPLLRVGHAPFRVPWNSVRSVERNTGWLARGLVLHLETKAGKIKLCLPAKAEAELLRHLPAALLPPAASA